MSGKIFGIDLGTTYSCIAYIDRYGRPVVVTNEDNETTTPSIVYFESPTNVVVGKHARTALLINPELTVEMVKRQMGDPDWQFEAHGNTFSPIHVSSLILKELSRQAELATGEPVIDVVITVPAYFGSTEREATRQAGQMAGLKVHYIVSEPSAAALYYGIEQNQDQTVMVYDLGGGTFDITIIRLTGNEFRVVATGGDHRLGGKDWDAALAGRMAEFAAAQTGSSHDDIINDPDIWRELLAGAEEVKRGLTKLDRVRFPLGVNGERIVIEVTRETFNQVTQHLLERTITFVKETLAEAAKQGVGTLDTILLVGGSTFMPQVQERLKEEFAAPQQLLDPNLAVAKGAALFAQNVHAEEWLTRWVEFNGGQSKAGDAANLAPEQRDRAIKDYALEQGISSQAAQSALEITVVDVSSKSFGIVIQRLKTNDHGVRNMIVRNQSIPASVKRTFATVADGQPAVRIICVENYRDEGPDEAAFDYDESEKLGEALLEIGPNDLPKGSPIELTLGLTADGRVELHGEEKNSGRQIRASFTARSLLDRKGMAEGRQLIADMSTAG